RVRALVRQSMQFEDAAPYTAEHRVLLPDGQIRWVSVKGKPDRTSDSQHTLTFDGTVADITDRKNAEAERELLLEAERMARSEAEFAGRMKDEFLATLSHEIRTPLNAILGWSHIMQQTDKREDIQRGLEVIERNARAQSQIIEDLLDMSSIISGKIRLNAQRLNLADIVQDAVAAARPTADAKNLRLDSIIDPMHGVEVSGDTNRLRQILWNLISNAIKFTGKDGRVRVLLERVNSHLEISVIDTGEGIAPEFLPHVFDRFRQADASTTRRHGGLGLGLSIVRQLVELHGGSVRVTSQGLGHGTTFIVALPLIAVQTKSLVNVERQHPRVSHTTVKIADACDDLDHVKVLIIDDEPDARALLQRLLEDCGAIVTVATSTDEVVRLVREQKFDVLVSDVGMPGEDGYSLIRRVRRLGAAQHGDIPAIALTAYARAEDRVKAIAAGFQMHIAKPVEPIEIITMVASAAGRVKIKD
ncbi:MAG: ATP-binding protein, partial [Gemmatimonadaceae bacterium]